MNLFLFAIIATVPLFFGLKAHARWILFRNRKVERLEDLFKSFQFKLKPPMDFQTFAKIISLIGECYHITPGKLRPDDSFDGNLAKLDTWSLGGGAEDLQRRLEKDISIQLRPDVRIGTVKELLDYCGAVLIEGETKSAKSGTRLNQNQGRVSTNNK